MAAGWAVGLAIFIVALAVIAVLIGLRSAWPKKKPERAGLDVGGVAKDLLGAVRAGNYHGHGVDEKFLITPTRAMMELKRRLDQERWDDAAALLDIACYMFPNKKEFMNLIPLRNPEMFPQRDIELAQLYMNQKHKFGETASGKEEFSDLNVALLGALRDGNWKNIKVEGDYTNTAEGMKNELMKKLDEGKWDEAAAILQAGLNKFPDDDPFNRLAAFKNPFDASDSELLDAGKTLDQMYTQFLSAGKGGGNTMLGNFMSAVRDGKWKDIKVDPKFLESPDTALDEIMRLLAAGKYDEAAALLAAASEKWPDDETFKKLKALLDPENATEEELAEAAALLNKIADRYKNTNLIGNLVHWKKIQPELDDKTTKGVKGRGKIGPNETIDDVLKRIKQMLLDGNLDGALELFMAAAEKWPDDSPFDALKNAKTAEEKKEAMMNILQKLFLGDDLPTEDIEALARALAHGMDGNSLTLPENITPEQLISHIRDLALSNKFDEALIKLDLGTKRFPDAKYFDQLSGLKGKELQVKRIQVILQILNGELNIPRVEIIECEDPKPKKGAGGKDTDQSKLAKSDRQTLKTSKSVSKLAKTPSIKIETEVASLRKGGKAAAKKGKKAGAVGSAAPGRKRSSTKPPPGLMDLNSEMSSSSDDEARGMATTLRASASGLSRSKSRGALYAELGDYENPDKNFQLTKQRSQLLNLKGDYTGVRSRLFDYQTKQKDDNILRSSASGMLNRSPSRMLGASPSRMLGSSPSRMLSQSPSRMLGSSPSRMLSQSPSKMLSTGKAGKTEDDKGKKNGKNGKNGKKDTKSDSSSKKKAAAQQRKSSAAKPKPSPRGKKK